MSLSSAEKQLLNSVKVFSKEGRRVINQWRIPKNKDSPKQWSIFPGDHVQVMAGKHAKTVGIVQSIKKDKCEMFIDTVVNAEIVNNAEGKETEISKHEPVAYKHVALLDPKDKKPTMIEWRKTQRGMIRYAQRSGQVIRVDKEFKSVRELAKIPHGLGDKDTPAMLAEMATFSVGTCNPWEAPFPADLKF